MTSEGECEGDMTGGVWGRHDLDMTGEGECEGDMTGMRECGGDMTGEGSAGET